MADDRSKSKFKSHILRYFYREGWGILTVNSQKNDSRLQEFHPATKTKTDISENHVDLFPAKATTNSKPRD